MIPISNILPAKTAWFLRLATTSCMLTLSTFVAWETGPCDRFLFFSYLFPFDFVFSTFSVAFPLFFSDLYFLIFFYTSSPDNSTTLASGNLKFDTLKVLALLTAEVERALAFKASATNF